MIGTTLGHFQIERKLGAGGMGEVYRARDTRLGRDVALKLLPQTTSEKLARFEREARAVAGLAHPNIVVLHAIEEHEGQHFLVLELVEGQDLSELIAPGGLPAGRVLELAIPIADALASAHERGVVHRDLKPANVKLARDGRVKVLDFGLARMREGDSDFARTVEAPLSGEGHVLGTVPYMAPEQIRGETVDARADLFGLGILIYELATGSRPFTGKTLADVSSAILRDAPPHLTDVRKELPAQLERIVERCLAKDPRDRYPSALDVANDLRRVVTGKPAPVREGDEVTIAVLPFVNRSANPDDEYFAEGLGDELLGVLARIRGLRVAGRTSSSRFKGATESVASIGEQLNVATLLEGSVRKAGSRVRIGVQLLRVSDGGAVWSQTYDRTLDDVFAVQDDIAHAIVKELRKTLLGEADDSDASREAKAEVLKAAAQGRSESPEAQRLLLQGRHFRMRRTAEGLTRAISLIDEALAIDPSFAAAWVELSQAHFVFVSMYLGDEEAHLARAHDAIRRALDLAPEMGRAHAHRAWMQLGVLDVKGARESVLRAMQLEPDDPDILRVAGIMAAVEGRFEDALRIEERAIALDPLSPMNYSNVVTPLLYHGRLPEALKSQQRAIELAPDAPNLRTGLARILVLLGRHEEALAEADREPLEGYRLTGRVLALDAAGRHDEADRDLDRLIRNCAHDFSFQIATNYACRGDLDRAFSWLETARTNKDPGLTELKSTPELERLHADPRWPGLLRSIGLEP